MGIVVNNVLNSNVTIKFKANPPQKNDKNKAASLITNHTKQYCIVLYKVVTSLIPYIPSVNISVKRKNKEKINKNTIMSKLVISKKNVHKDNPKKTNNIKIKYIKNNGE